MAKLAMMVWEARWQYVSMSYEGGWQQLAYYVDEDRIGRVRWIVSH